MRINEIVTDEEIVSITDLDVIMIRNAIDLTQQQTLVDQESFADVIAFSTGDWDTAYIVAKAINNLIFDKFTK